MESFTIWTFCSKIFLQMISLENLLILAIHQLFCFSKFRITFHHCFDFELATSLQESEFVAQGCSPWSISQFYSPSNAWALAIADADTCTGLPAAVWNRGCSGAGADLQSGSSPKSPDSDTSSILAHLHFWFPDRCTSHIVIIQPTSH